MSFSVLVVCLANVCRSPLGERLLAHRLDERGVADAYAVTSAGVRAFEGREMSPQSAVELRARGGDDTDFAATQLGRDHRGSDLVLVATRELRSKVLERFPGLMRRTFTVREVAAVLRAVAAEDPDALAAATTPAELVALCAGHRGRVTLGDDADVPDPIGRADEVYAEVAVMLDDALTELADALARVSRADSTAASSAAATAATAAGEAHV